MLNSGGRKPLVIYIQYTNPAGYPPLEHSSQILAGLGWDIVFLGAPARGADRLAFPPNTSINLKRLRSFGGGMLQKLHYLVYIAWCILVCLWRRPNWIYVSEPTAALPALVIQRICRVGVLYHEHDSPTYKGKLTLFQTLSRIARAKLAVTASLVVLPQQDRLLAFVAETGRSGQTACVWNCPRVDEVVGVREAISVKQPLHLYYHGSINQERLPLAILDALAQGSPTARLTVLGYETLGSVGYVAAFMARARTLGLERRVEHLDAMCRAEAMAQAAQADIGLAFMPIISDDRNMTQMVGASNKPFDYLAVGLMLLVSDLPDWNAVYVEPGYGVSCDPTKIDRLAQTIAWCDANRDRVRAMGEAGRQRVLLDWNYEQYFAPIVLGIQTGPYPSASGLREGRR